MDELCSGPGYTTLDASGLSVGLPAGLMGNSEVGHLNIGAGRVVYQVSMFKRYLSVQQTKTSLHSLQLNFKSFNFFK